MSARPRSRPPARRRFVPRGAAAGEGVRIGVGGGHVTPRPNYTPLTYSVTAAAHAASATHIVTTSISKGKLRSATRGGAFEYGAGEGGSRMGVGKEEPTHDPVHEGGDKTPCRRMFASVA